MHGEPVATGSAAGAIPRPIFDPKLEQAFRLSPVWSSAGFTAMATASKNIVGPQVRRLRVASGMSQAAFAASCQRAGWDVGRAVLAKIECGIRCVEDRELLELAKALRCPLADLYPARAQAVIRGKKSASGSP